MLRHLAQYLYVGHIAVKFAKWLFTDMQKQKKILLERLYEQNLEEQKLCVMPFSLQTK